MSRYINGPGIPDDEFIRKAGVPMTKYEIRVLSLSLLRMFPGMVLYDVGAGSGSISIEARISVPESSIFAIERNTHALQVMKENCRKFGVELSIIEGTAPLVLDELPAADRVFVGGSGGMLESLLIALDKKMKPGGRLVLNSVTMHSASQAFSLLESLGYQMEARQVNIAFSSKQGSAVIWRARNPVTIICGWKGEV